jgi:MoaA/NifB/PqqE/SkfB family radical SAM enzyme
LVERQPQKDDPVIVDKYHMKIFPIKLERVSTNYPKIVEWQLGNTCNYDCHFCPSHIKNGSLKWLDINHVKRVCKSLIDSTDSKIKFIFTE